MVTISWRMAALAITAMLAACSWPSQSAHVPPSAPLPPANIPPTVASREALGKVPGGPAVPFTGNPDQEFAANMIPHREASIHMAEIELEYGHNPVLRRLARQIIRTDAASRNELDAWLRAHPVKQQ